MDIGQSAILLFSKVLHSTQCFWTNIWFRRWQVETLNMNIYCFWVRKEQTSSANITKHTENCSNVKDNRCNIFWHNCVRNSQNTIFSLYPSCKIFERQNNSKLCESKERNPKSLTAHSNRHFLYIIEMRGPFSPYMGKLNFSGRLMGRFFK